jgi:hypothetical protein
MMRSGRQEREGILVMNEAATLNYEAPRSSKPSDATGDAFEAAWTILCASGEPLSAQQACDTRICLARAILTRFQEGERDPIRLQQMGLASLIS